MNSLEDMKKKYEELGEAIKRLEDKPDEWPQAGDEYWAGVADSGCVTSVLYDGDSYDDYRKAIGDMHRTKEEADAYRAFRMNPRTVMRDRIQLWVDVYNRGMRGKYTISRGGNILKDAGLLNPIAIKDGKGAELLLEKFGLENILWACGGRNPSDSDGPEPGGE